MIDPNEFVVRAYRHLMTEFELRADRAFVYDLKMRGTSDNWLSNKKSELLADPQAAEHFSKGRERFLSDVVQRLAREHATEIVRCQRCNHILRTQNAKQCLHCGFDWH